MKKVNQQNSLAYVLWGLDSVPDMWLLHNNVMFQDMHTLNEERKGVGDFPVCVMNFATMCVCACMCVLVCLLCKYI